MVAVSAVEEAITAHALQNIERLPNDPASAAIEKAREAFLEESGDVCWWWEHFRKDLPTASFRDPSDAGFLLLPVICPEQRSYLFVTDDKFPPWPVFVGETGALTAVIGQCHSFEYLVVDPAMKWIVCENHHGVVIAIGETVAQRLKSYAG